MMKQKKKDLISELKRIMAIAERTSDAPDKLYQTAYNLGAMRGSIYGLICAIEAGKY
jgi:hypothetical protein